MKNLVEQASLWLQSEECRSGSIQDRTSAVISLFRKYVSEAKEEVCVNITLPFHEITKRIDETARNISQILAAFLRGNQQDAFEKTYKMMKSMKFDKLYPNLPLYKSRENDRLFHYTKDEMFHIPYSKRNLVGNQRYSLSGIPCLYVGGSSYICWEELGRKDLSSSNYCGYSLKEDFNLFDMLLPISITNPHQIRRIVLILACSLAADRNALFKPEYILPQCILHSLIKRTYYSHTLFCVRYYSTHLLNGDAAYFPFDFSREEVLSRYINYVFPAPSSNTVGYSEELRKVLNQTDTISLLRETLLDPGRLMCACNNDAYLDSQFGLVDAILDEKLGIIPKRREGTIFLAKRD